MSECWMNKCEQMDSMFGISIGRDEGERISFSNLCLHIYEWPILTQTRDLGELLHASFTWDIVTSLQVANSPHMFVCF